MEGFGDRLRQIRVAANINQTELAEELRRRGLETMHRVTVSNWENDKQEPSTSAIVALTEIFGVSSDFLLYGKDGMRLIEAEQSIIRAMRASDSLVVIMKCAMALPDGDRHVLARMACAMRSPEKEAN